MAIVRKSGAIRVTLNRAADLIRSRIKSNLFHRPVLILGAPGIGKSYIFSEMAKELGAELRTAHLENMEAVDIDGMPIPVPDKGECAFVPNKLFVFEPGKKYILLLDELTSCNPATQLAAMKLMLDRTIAGDTKIPDSVFIVAAGNRSEDGSKVYTLLSTASNRLAHLEIENDVSNWLTWGRQNGIHPNILGFIGYKPSYLHMMDEEQAAATEDGVKKSSNTGRYSGPWYSNRSVAAASDLVWAVDNGEIDEGDLHDQVAMECGDAFALEFCAFRKVAGAYDNVRDIMIDPTKKVSIPQKADMKFAFASAVVYNVWKAHDDTEQEALVQGFYRIINDAGMDSSFATKIWSEAQEGSSRVDKLKACHILVDEHLTEFSVASKKMHKDQLAKV